MTAASAAPALAAGPRTYILTRRADRLFVSARINGQAVDGLLDSAAEVSLVSPAFAGRLKLGAGEAALARGSGKETTEATLVDHVRIEAAGVSVPDATVAVIDLSDISKRLIGVPVEAVIGREIFDQARLLVDIRNGAIRALAADERPKGRAMPLVERRGIMLMPAQIEGRALVEAEFDLGNGTRTILSGRYAKAAGLLDGRPTTDGSGGGLGGAKTRKRIVLKSLTVAGATFRDIEADIDEEADHDANLGVELLQHFRIVTDFAGKRIWLDKI